VKLKLTNYQIKKLKEFSLSLNDTYAGVLIHEITDILNNMFDDVENYKIESFAENLSKIIISITMDPRFQISLFILFIVYFIFNNITVF
jgi:hypothetical protein